MEGPGKSVFVQYIKPDLGAARSRRIEVGKSLHIPSSTSSSSFYLFFYSFFSVHVFMTSHCSTIFIFAFSDMMQYHIGSTGILTFFHFHSLYQSSEF